MYLVLYFHLKSTVPTSELPVREDPGVSITVQALSEETVSVLSQLNVLSIGLLFIQLSQRSFHYMCLWCLLVVMVACLHVQ